MTERYVINDDMIEDTLSDDYYHFNDWRDFEGLCKLANSLYEDNKPLQDEIQRISKDFKKEVNEIIKAHNTLRRENEELKETIRKRVIKEFTITKEDLNREEARRITELTNHILVEFCKSKGHSLEEITEFVEGLPNE